MRKTKKGFTLIELLAIIVILVAITLIVTPVIGNAIEKSHIKVSTQSVINYVKQANDSASFYKLDHSKGLPVTTDKYVYDSQADDLSAITITGTRPTYVFLMYNTDTYTVSSGKFCINDYSIDYLDGTANLSSDDYCHMEPVELLVPTITYRNNPGEASNDYLYESILNVDFAFGAYTKNYIKSTRDAKIDKSTLKSCGVDELSTCVDEKVSTLEAGKWYQVADDVILTYDSPSDDIATLYVINYLGEEFLDTTATVAKIDREIPIISHEAIGGTVMLTLTDTKSGIGYFCVTATEGVCEWEASADTAVWQADEIGTYYAYAKDNVGNISSSDTVEITDLTAAYPATPVCSNGGTYSNGSCYYSNNQSICGCAEYNYCNSSSCGVSSTTYNSCANEACGTETVCGTCTKNLWQYCCNNVKQGSNEWCTTASSGNGTKCPSGYVIDPSNNSRCYKGADKCYYDYTYENDCNKCGSTPVNKTCQTSACGVASQTYYSCTSSSCGCKSGKSCNKTTGYLSYTCPDGGRLEGAVCIK